MKQGNKKKNNRRIPQSHTHIFRPCRTIMHILKMIGGKLFDELRPQRIYSNTNRTWKNTKSKKWKKQIKYDGRITHKTHARLQTMAKSPAKFQKVWFLIVLRFNDTSNFVEKGTKEMVEEIIERDREKRGK